MENRDIQVQEITFEELEELNKILMECWISFLKCSSKKKNDEYEAVLVLDDIIQVLKDLSNIGVFKNRVNHTLIAGEIFFLNTFLPQLINLILNETTKLPKPVQQKQKEILLILLNEFLLNIADGKFKLSYEALSNIFADNKPFYKNSDNKTQKYCEDFYQHYQIEFNPEGFAIPFEFNSKRFYVIPKPKEFEAADIIYTIIANEFIDDLQGFEVFRRTLKNIAIAASSSSTSSTVEYELVWTIIDIIFNLHDKLHPVYASEYLKDFWINVSEILLLFSLTEMRNVKRDLVEKTFKKLKDMIGLVYTKSEVDEIFNVFSLQFGMNCFRMPTVLNKKLLGLKILNVTLTEILLSNANNNIPFARLSRMLLDKDKDNFNNIFDYLYGSQSHSQIMQKSSELIKTLFQLQILSVKELQEILSLATSANDQEAKGIIYQTLSSNAKHMGLEHVKFLLDTIMEINPSDLMNYEIDLLGSLYKAACALSCMEYMKKSTMFFFNLFFKSSLDESLLEFTVKQFVKMMKDKEQKEILKENIRYIIDYLREENEHFILGLKVVRQLLQNFTQNEIREIITDDDINKIVDTILRYLTDYHAIAQEITHTLITSSFIIDLENTTFASINWKNSKTHAEIVTEIISFFKMIINNQINYSLSHEHVGQLFYIFVEDPINTKDPNIFFKWITEAGEKKVIPEGAFEHIFYRMLQLNLRYSHATVGDELYNFVWKIFLKVNKMKTEPFEMEGIHLIWKLLLCLKEDTLKKSIESFLKLFENKIGAQNNLLEWCINAIASARGSDTRRMEIMNSLMIIAALIGESEKRGTCGCISHSALLKSSIFSLKFVNLLNRKYNSLPANEREKLNLNFTLRLYSNTNIWDLKKLLGKRLNILPKFIKLSLLKEIPHSDHGKTISELKINEGEAITISKNSIVENIPKKELLQRDQSLSENAKSTFCGIFNDFSMNGLMSKEQYAEFVSCSSVDSNAKVGAGDKFVKMIFDKYDKDKDNFLNVEDFMQIFLDSLLDEKKAPTIWENLKALNFRNDLKKLHEPFEEDITEPEATLMPRFILSKNQIFFSTLFSLQDEDEMIAKESSKLLEAICTNPVIFKGILSNTTNQTKWETLMDTTNQYKLLYSLQIIESFCEELEITSEQNVDCERLQCNVLDKNDMELLDRKNKIQWIENFLANGGLSHIVKNILFNDQIISKDTLSTTIGKKIFSLVLQIINTSLTLLYLACGNEFKKKAIIHLLSDNISIGATASTEHSSQEEEDDIVRDAAATAIVTATELSLDSIQQEINAKSCKEKRFINLSELSLIENINYDYASIVGFLMRICFEISSKSKSHIDGDDQVIILNSLNLFSLIILLQDDPSTFLNMHVLACNTIDFESFFLSGVLKSENLLIRTQFSKSLNNLVSHLLRIQETSFLKELIKICYNNLTDLDPIDRSRCCFFFELFKGLLVICLKLKNQDQDQGILLMLDKKIEDIAVELTNLVVEGAIIDDELLAGYLKILSEILKKVGNDMKAYCGKSLNLIESLLDKYFIKDIENEPSVNSFLKDTLTSYSMVKQKDSKFQFLDKIKNQTDDTINAIFGLMFILIKNNPDNLHMLFSSKKFSEISNYISKRSKDKKGNVLSSGRKSSHGFLGMKNLSATCYMNSIIQQFFAIPSLRYAVIQASDNMEAVYGDTNKEIDDNLLHQMQKMFIYLELSHRGDYDPTEFVYSFKDIEGKPTDYKQQCDAQEFLVRLMEKLDYLLKMTKFKYIFPSVLFGESCSQLTCTNGCGKISNRFEDLYDLSLEIRNKKTLKESLDKYIEEEIIDDFYCEICRKKTQHTKRVSLSHLPNVLVIHLQRIAFNYESMTMEKINTRLEFPSKLSMKNYCTEYLAKSLEGDDSFTERVYPKEDDYYHYHLVGVVVHSGTAQSGHYYSFINSKRGGCDDIMNYSPEEDQSKWLRLDDSSISSYNIAKLEDDTFGGSSCESSEESDSIADFLWGTEKKSEWNDKSRNAYMLVYERTKKSPIKIVDIEHQKEMANMMIFNEKTKFKVMKNFDYFRQKEILTPECENTSTCKCVCVSKQDIFKYTFYNEDNGENFYYVPYYWMLGQENILVPSNYFVEVAIDNLKLFNEEKVFSKPFGKFIEKVTIHVESLIKNGKIPVQDSENIIDILNKAMMQILSKSCSYDTLKGIVTSLSNILEISPELSDTVIKYFITIKHYLIYDLILANDDRKSSCYSQYLVKNLIVNMILHSHEIKSGVKTDAIKLIDYLYSLFPNEIAKNWTRMSSFLQIFEGLARANHEVILTFMFQKSTIAKLIDFFLMKDSPLCKKAETRLEMGNQSEGTGKFSSLVATVSILARHCPTETCSIDDRIPFTFIKTEGVRCFELTENDAKCLTCNLFYKKSIMSHFNLTELSKLISHVMLNNNVFTYNQIPYIMELINEGISANDIKSAFDLLSNILAIEDKYTAIRLEALMGVPILAMKMNDFPSLVERNSNNFENIYKYTSPYSPNKETLVDRIINKYRTSVDYMTALAFFFELLFKSPSVFNYFDSLPHPKLDMEYLHHYICQSAKDEIQRCKKTTSTAMKFEKQIQSVESSLEMYAKKREEFSTITIQIPSQMRYKFGNIIRESLSRIPNEAASKINLHLISAEYDTEVFFNNSIDYQEIPVSQIEFQAESVTDQVKGVVDMILDNLTDEKTTAIPNKKEILPTKATMENFAKSNIKTLIEYHTFPNPPLARINTRISNPYSETPHIITPVIKRYTLINVSNKDYKVSLQCKTIGCDIPNCFIPQCDINIISKKNTVVHVITFVKRDLHLPFTEVIFDISFSEFDSNDEEFESETQNKKPKRTRSFGTGMKEAKDLPPLKSSHDMFDVPLKSKGMTIEKLTLQEDSGLDIACPSCQKNNKIRDGDSILKCKFCKSPLLI